jgi:hypothetical protein
VCAEKKRNKGSQMNVGGTLPRYVQVETPAHSADKVVVSSANKDASLAISNSPVLRVAIRQFAPRKASSTFLFATVVS